MKRLLLTGLMLAISCCSFASPAVAGDPCIKENCGPCCPPECGPYKATCCPSVEPDVEEHYCWQVERDFVCIPPVKFPWQKCCDLGCPRIRPINKLKIHKYECNVCKFKWNLKKFYPCCDNSCADDCAK